jgi:hypothetical protein
VYLKDLHLPPEMVREVEASYRRRGLWWWEKKVRKYVEEEFKLMHFYGGKEVALLNTPAGTAVLYVGRITREDLSRLLPELTAEEWRNVLFDCPRPWGDPVSQL